MIRTSQQYIMTAREQVDGANLSQAHVHATDTTQRACTTVSRGTAFGPPCGYHLQWGIRMCKRCGPLATREEGCLSTLILDPDRFGQESKHSFISLL